MSQKCHMVFLLSVRYLAVAKIRMKFRRRIFQSATFRSLELLESLSVDERIYSGFIAGSLLMS
jgi:hypothetical protein